MAFGPVPSRRLGLSVGVNAVPRKVCSYNCVFCQLGRTTDLTTRRDEYTPTDAIVSAIRAKLSQAAQTDFVTFIGDGEPTLASNLGEVLSRVSEFWDGRTALITNGSLFWMPEVREVAARFDVVMPTVSAGDPGVFRKVHRPHGDLSFEDCAEGLREFARGYSGRVWAEVMLVRGLNDSPGSLERIGKVIGSLNPAEVHITAPIRPPSVSSVEAPTRETVEMALREIPGSVDFTHPEATEVPSPGTDPETHLIEISGTHPLRREQAIALLVNSGHSHDEAHRVLDSMVDSSRLVVLERHGSKFYVRGRPLPDGARRV